MNSQNDDYRSKALRSTPLDLCRVMQLEYSMPTEYVVKTRTKSLKTVIFNALCSRYLHFQIFIRSCSTPVRVLLALNQVTQFIHFYHKLLIFFNEYDTNTNCNNCISQICCLLTLNKRFIS